MRLRTFAVAVVASLMCFASPGAAQVPRTISYQGILTDINGQLIPDGNHVLIFGLYTSVTGGVPVYADTQTVEVKNAVFNAVIGSRAAMR